MILTSRGPEQQSNGLENVLSFINLALALGKWAGPRRLRLSHRARETGKADASMAKGDQLPEYRKSRAPQARCRGGVPETDLPGPGKSAYEMLDALGTEEGVRGLFVFASNIAVSASRAAHIEARLRALDLLVVTDFFLSETAELADVVLHCTQWAEEEGTMTNLEGRVLLGQRAMAPPPRARSDLEIMQALAERLGYGSKFSASARSTFAELRRASAGGVTDYAGVTYERIIQEDGVFCALPQRKRCGYGAPFYGALSDEERASPVPGGRVSRVRRAAGCRIPALSHDRPGDGSLSIRYADAPG